MLLADLTSNYKIDFTYYTFEKHDTCVQGETVSYDTNQIFPTVRNFQ